MSFIFMIIKNSLKTVILFLKTIEVLYYVTYGLLSFMGVYVHPFFFAFHLTEILLRYPTLKNVIKSVWEPKDALILTFLLFLIIEYMFSLAAYSFIYKDYKDECSSMISCFLVTFDQGLKVNIYIILLNCF